MNKTEAMREKLDEIELVWSAYMQEPEAPADTPCSGEFVTMRYLIEANRKLLDTIDAKDAEIERLEEEMHTWIIK